MQAALREVWKNPTQAALEQLECAAGKQAQRRHSSYARVLGELCHGGPLLHSPLASAWNRHTSTISSSKACRSAAPSTSATRTDHGCRRLAIHRDKSAGDGQVFCNAALQEEEEEEEVVVEVLLTVNNK